ncbi:DUF6266 family protein [Flavobacterium sp.]|uniref:DUF6266 family protein n=1 Tax=Flavobacterium sp. TaxID=239 RepID=UPI00260BB6B5|nr:DUF6266 family protein [Flavobacterium sp.]
MGKFEKGILGGFRGTIGPVVGANWRGLDVMRSRPKRGSRVASAKQLQQRMAFALVIRFITPIRALLDNYFGQPANERSRFDLASSFFLREAVTGVYPDMSIDYARVMITKGDLAGVQDAALTALALGTLQFTWADNSGQPEAVSNDLLLAVVYNPDKARFLYSHVEQRSSGLLSLSVPDAWAGDAVHCWLGFTALGGHRASTSVYLTGTVV